MADLKTRTVINKKLGKFQKRIECVYGIMGDGNGNVKGSREPYALVRQPDNAVIEIYNKRVQFKDGLPVLCGYDPLEPFLFQVLSIWTTALNDPSALSPTNVLPKHSERQGYYGDDPLFIEKRAYLPARVGVAATGGLSVDVYQDTIYINGGWTALAAQTIDLSSYLPTASGASTIVLLTYAIDGSITQTAHTGLVYNSELITDIPAIPSGEIGLAAVRLYTGQTVIRDGYVNRDITDCRTWLSATSGGGGGGHTIQDEGTPLTTRANLNFVGSGVTATDDAGNDATLITIPSGSGGDFVHNIDGTLTVNTNIAAFVASRILAISKVYLYGFTLGASSSTIVDVSKNGTTIFTTQANRPTLDYNDADHVAISGVPDVISLAIGDVLTIDIDQVAVGASGLAVVIGVSGGGGGGSGTLNDYICIQDQKTQNTPGGTFTSGAWLTRDLNTIQSDDGGHASVASNQITLAAGTYTCRIVCPAYCVNENQAKLYNVTDAADILLGTTHYTNATNYNAGYSFVQGKFTLAAQKVLEVRHRCGSTQATNGMGTLCNFGTEVYTVAEFWRVG